MPVLLAAFVVTHLCGRLRQVDIKAEHFERQVQRVEQERDTWTKQYEVCATITGLLRPTCHLSPHKLASLIAYPARRKWTLNTARRRQSWTSLLRTWRVSSLAILASLYRDAYPRPKLGLSFSFEERLRSFINITFIVSYTEGYWLGE
jgi:hypothetical protein